MNVLFQFQDVLKIVQSGYQEIGDNPTVAQRVIHKDAVKSDNKALFLIHQSLDASIFDKISKHLQLRKRGIYWRGGSLVDRRFERCDSKL